MRTSMLEDVRAYIAKHPDSGPEAVARALGCSEATARKHLTAIAAADTIAQDRRVARVDSQQDESAAEVERLTERVLDLNELVVDLVFENTRLRRGVMFDAYRAFMCVVFDTDASPPVPLYAHATSEWPPTTTLSRSHVLVFETHGSDFQTAHAEALRMSRTPPYAWLHRLPQGVR